MTDVEKKARYLAMIRELTENFPTCDRPELVVARNHLKAAIDRLITAIDARNRYVSAGEGMEAEDLFDSAFEAFSLAMFRMNKLKSHNVHKKK